ncbi:MAG TPA: SRPBCC domain-containing protein [Sphingomonas sp.]|nr:SRPBCC domain-containing protein [Sphingomonas sp.]
MNDVALQTRSQEIVVDEIFPHAIDTVWKTLTSGELMGRWLGMEPTGFEPVVGNRFTYQTTPAGAWDGVIRCEILEIVPNERFAYSWRGGDESNIGYGSLLDTVVTFTLAKAKGGTRLHVTHTGFVLPRNETAYRNMSGGWTKVVSRLGALADEQGSADQQG